jgi:hypothetical protein
MSEVKVRVPAGPAAVSDEMDVMAEIYSITTELELAGYDAIAEGLETLAEVIDGFAPRAMKAGWLSGIRLLGEQAALPAGKRDREAVMATLNDLRSGLPKSPRVERVWQRSAPGIIRFFH